MHANVACRQSLDHLCAYMQANGQHLVEAADGDTMASAVIKQFTVARMLANKAKNNTTARASSAAVAGASTSAGAGAGKEPMFTFSDDIDYDMDVTEYELYREFGDDSDGDNSRHDESSRITFPMRLFDAVTEESKDSDGCLIWRAEDNGRSFRIRDLSKFVAEGIFRLFKLRNFSSFQRLLHLHGFVRVPVFPHDDSLKQEAFSSASSSSLSSSSVSASRAMVAAGVSTSASSSAHMLLSLASGDTARADARPVATFTTPAGLTLRVLRSDRYVYSHPQFQQGQRSVVGSIARTVLLLPSSLSSSSSSSSSSTSSIREEITTAPSLLMFGGDGGNTSNGGIRVGDFAAGEDLGTSAGHKRRAPSSSSVPAPPAGLEFGDEVFFTNAPLPLTLTTLRQSHSEQYRGIYQNVTAAAAAMRKRAKVSKSAASASSSGGAGAGAVQSNENAATEMDGCFVVNGASTGDDMPPIFL